MVAFRRHQNPRNHLVRAMVKTLQNFVPPSCGPRNRPGFHFCRLIPESTISQKHHESETPLYCTFGANCSSTNVIYCIKCDMFVGLSTLAVRMIYARDLTFTNLAFDSTENVERVSTNITVYLPVSVSNVPFSEVGPIQIH